MEIVRKSCDGGAVAVHGNRRVVQSSYDFFCPNDHLKPCDYRKISARPPHDTPTTCQRATGL